jgi:WhiB family transcriptional regulator, redox-sensing transcriptional regulator
MGGSPTLDLAPALAGDHGIAGDAAVPATKPHRHPVDVLIAKAARCADPRSSYTPLFFSENPLDGIRAKAICARCTVRSMCLARALERKEPFGVWGGEFVLDGEVVAVRRGRGRPRKAPLPTLVDEVTGVPIVA